MGPWWDAYFDADFAEIYGALLGDDESAEEAAAAAGILALEPGDAVLDLACGWGRHAIPLARGGCRVVGLDRSAHLLARAAAEGAPARWVRGDVRHLPFGSRFRAVLSLFSSLGYFPDEADDLRALREVRRVLLPDGLFLLETMHRDLVAREFVERDWWEMEDGRTVWVEREFDPVAGISHEALRWRTAHDSVGEKRHSIRVRAASEWDALLRRAGLTPLAWYGSWEMEPFSVSSERLIVVAEPLSS
jgi:SAM-dependent methyltransferase